MWKVIVLSALGAAAAIAAGYFIGRGIIKAQDSNDPPVTSE